MSTADLRKRAGQAAPAPKSSVDSSTSTIDKRPHPGGEIKHGPFLQVVRLLIFIWWFWATAACISTTQFLGVPLYWINRDYYYAYMALTKQSFGIVCACTTRWFSRTLVRVSWDASVHGELQKTKDGRLETKFPERLVLITNHQIYTDWLYLWWIAYTSKMHGHIFIILKDTLKYIPFIGPGMMFYGFVFMSRKWAADKPKLQHRLEKLKTRHGGPMSGSAGLDPAWLIIYPEGTNLSANTRGASSRWAQKQGIADLRHVLLPRSTGLLFCLKELRGTVDWVYDCTVAYQGTPKGGYAAEYFTLRSVFLQGRPPKSVNMYWRRFALSSIPLEDSAEFDTWVLDRWKEKDEFLEQYYNTGLFPAEAGSYIDTEVKLKNWYEIGQICAPIAAVAMVANVIIKLYGMFS